MTGRSEQWRRWFAASAGTGETVRIIAVIKAVLIATTAALAVAAAVVDTAGDETSARRSEGPGAVPVAESAATIARPDVLVVPAPESAPWPRSIREARILPGVLLVVPVETPPRPPRAAGGRTRARVATHRAR